jgi:hypothetical protein
VRILNRLDRRVELVVTTAAPRRVAREKEAAV